MEISVCPGCDGEEWELTGRAASDLSFTAGGRPFSHPDYRVRHCRNCGLYFKSDVMDWDLLQEYYDRAASPQDGRLNPAERAVLAVLWELRGGAKILHYECGTGKLLAGLVKNYECYGSESNREAAKIAASRGVRIIAERYAVPEEFDALVLCDVFEHWPQPTAKLTELLESVKPDGMVVIATGNADAPAAARDVANFWYFRRPEHLVMLGRRHADYLGRRLGLELVRWEGCAGVDVGITERLVQEWKQFVYRSFHGDRPAFWEPLLRWIPGVNRARAWKYSPAYTCSRDHVVVVYRKRLGDAGR